MDDQFVLELFERFDDQLLELLDDEFELELLELFELELLELFELELLDELDEEFDDELPMKVNRASSPRAMAGLAPCDSTRPTRSDETSLEMAALAAPVSEKNAASAALAAKVSLFIDPLPFQSLQYGMEQVRT